MSIQEPIKLKDLMETGAFFTVNTDQMNDGPETTEEDVEYNKNLLNFMNMQVAGFEDEDSYVDGQPFEIIASKMEHLTRDGGIKKRILREGYGEKPKDAEIVRINYNAYIEYNAEPFDSTYARKKVHQFIVNNGEVLLGLDIAVQSMRINEKSQFLMQPMYAYGKLGCLQRVPPDTEVMFEIELIQIVNVSAASKFETLSIDEQKKFDVVYEYCLALCAKAKDLYAKNVHSAIREYNSAASKLEFCQLDTYEDQVKQQELLLRLYSNLLVAHAKVEEPRRGCVNFNKIRELVKGTDIKVTAKMYFNNAKCLRMLGDYELARKRLDQAHRMEPKNPDILNEYILLDKAVREDREKTTEIAKKFLK
ncbi:unnamed protein product [Phyllotreta striolata]|uniref:PPIase FKBP-type domain-containing protein n=1 Tax=Phyllotreta striolata TaxID=444603 RepID=A0A9N9THL6_PHYSR|nr:unnamed protein product [Phyllotreta striolata]